MKKKKEFLTEKDIIKTLNLKEEDIRILNEESKRVCKQIGGMKMNLLELMREYYPEEAEKLKEKLPKIYDFAKQVETIQWQKEFEIADKNPELFENLRVLEMLYDSKMISEEDYIRERDKILKSGYSSITMGVAFIDDKKVSFREKVPNFIIILHELGHIYFRASDLPWNAMYGGAEILTHFALMDKIEITEKEIKDYIAIYTLVYLAKPEVIEEIEKIIISNITNQEMYRLIPVLFFSGILPSLSLIEEGEEILYQEYEPEKIEKNIQEGKIKLNLQALKSSLLTFISAYLQDGIRYRDPFLQRFAIEFFKNTEKILSEILKTYNISMNDFRELEKELGSEAAVYELIQQEE